MLVDDGLSDVHESKETNRGKRKQRKPSVL